MPSRDGPARGKIIPFPAAAIRRPPQSAFVTQPASARRVPPRGRLVLAWFALGSLLAALLAAFLFASAASRAAHRHGARTGDAAAAALRTAVPGSVNVLVTCLDAEDGAGEGLEPRSDAIALLHLDADRERAWVVSIPRDARVTVPEHGERRIDSAHALGGPALFVATFERLTRLPVDHVAVVDRNGLRRLTDGVGGVPLDLAPPAASEPRRGGLALELSGAMAVDYVHEQDPPAAGDREHIRREHRYLRALLAQLQDRGTLADRSALRELVASLGSTVRVDAALAPATLRSLLESTVRLGAGQVTFVTAPVVPAGPSSGPAIVRPDAARCAQLWDALAHDEMPAFVAAHPELVTPADAR